MSKRRRFAVIGTGNRAAYMFVAPLIEKFSDEVEAVGLYDINPARAEVCNEIVKSSIPIFRSAEELIRKARPEVLLIASPDATHAGYVIQGLKAGLDVFCEKPLCTTREQVTAIRKAARVSSGKATVTHNLRCLPSAEVLKRELRNHRIGTVRHVIFNEYLDRYHGADYFRRWHRNFKNSGGLLLQKASHHFDMVNWWVGSRAQTVTAQGGLLYYGKNGPFRGTRCSTCAHTRKCPHYADLFANPFMQKLYQRVEKVDGYLRDRCVFGNDIDITDTANLTVTFENGVKMVYSLIAYASFEGQQVALEGTQGRLEWHLKYNTGWAAGSKKGSKKASLEQSGEHSEKVEYLHPFNHEVTDLTPPALQGSHGGADAKIWDFIFKRRPPADPLGQRASLEEGIQAVLIGMAANQSIALGGAPVNVQTGRPV
jgi:predicted dehydrogenase